MKKLINKIESNTIGRLAIETVAKAMKSMWVFTGVMAIIYLIFVYLNYRFDNPVETFFVFSYPTMGIYMILVGIFCAISFVPEYVKLGVTRSKAFYGSLNGLIVTTIVLMFLMGTVSFILDSALKAFDFGLIFEGTLFEGLFPIVDSTTSSEIAALHGNHLLAGINRWLITFLTTFTSLNLLSMLGWLVGSAVYIDGIIRGAIMFLLAVSFLSLSQFFWSSQTLGFLPSISVISNNLLSWILGLIFTIAVIVISAVIIRFSTRKMTIVL